MARKTWTWTNPQFTLDADAGETHRQTIVLDGNEYEINISPKKKLVQLRESLRKQAGADPSISLGPRGGCDCCGR